MKNRSIAKGEVMEFCDNTGVNFIFVVLLENGTWLKASSMLLASITRTGRFICTQRNNDAFDIENERDYVTMCSCIR